MNSKIAVVTGAGSGIGRAASIALQSAGFFVVVAGRRKEELEKTAVQGNMLVVPTDVTNPESVKALFGRLDRIDLLFNNAGMGAPAVPMDELTFEQWTSV